MKFSTFMMSNDDKQKLLELQNEFKFLNPNVLRALYARGVRDKDSIKEFFNCSIESVRLNKEFTNGEILVEKLSKCWETIVIAGDYDCDGICGTSVAYLGLRELGYDVGYYLNSRDIGYGLKPQSVDEILLRFPNVKVILTVDNGITANEGIEYANSKGIRVFVTDHHKQDGDLPNAEVIVNPNQDCCTSEFKGNCGAAVIWKVIRDLAIHKKNEKALTSINDLLDLVAIATIADQVPLLDDNRTMVKIGFKLLNRRSRFSIDRLLTVAGQDNIEEESVGYYIAPLINAINRLELDCNDVVRMLTADYDDKVFIDEFCQTMLDANKERKRQSEIQNKIAMRIAQEQIDECGSVPNIFVIYDESFTEGIVGILAGNITEKYNRPSVVLCNRETFLKGSARSVGNINIKETFAKVRDCFISFGGHHGAAGCNVSLGGVDYLRESLLSVLADVSPSEFDKSVLIDFVLSGDTLDKLNKDKVYEVASMFDCMKPFGASFPSPRVYLSNFKVDEGNSTTKNGQVYYVGKNEDTLRLVDGERISCMMFDNVRKYDKLGRPSVIDAVGKITLNEYKDWTNLQFVIEKDYIMKK